MSLVKSNFMSVVKKQYIFKLQACSKFFLIIIATQIIGMLFALTNAGGNMSTSNSIYILILIEILLCKYLYLLLPV